MLRVAIGSGLLAAGYLLLFAGVAEGGRYALRPWDALTNPAGGTTGSSGGGSSSSGGGGAIGAAESILKDLIPFGIP